MNKENNRKPKTGSELISSFFEQLNKNRNQYPCPEIIEIIVNLHKQNKLTKTNIANALEEIRNNAGK